MKMRRWLLVIALAGLHGACAEILEPEPKDMLLPPGLIFADARSLGDLSEFDESTSPPTIRVRPGRVLVFGRVPIPCPGYSPTGELGIVSDSIKLRVTPIEPTEHGCPAVLSAILYRGIVDVVPGTYVLSIQHDLATGVWTKDTTIVVP